MKIIREVQEEELILKAIDEGDVLKVTWEGRSSSRSPSATITPFLEELAGIVQASNQRLEMDFTQLQYMNSSTIAPMVQLLDKAKENGFPLSLLYNKSRSWQEISFSAMKIFECDDPVIRITAV